MKKQLIYYFVILICLYKLNHANAQVINLFPVKDNTIYSEADSSNGKGLFLFSGKNKNSGVRRALIKFDLSSLNGSDSVISANLQLYLSKTVTESVNIELYRLTRDWGEGESDAIFEEGGGATAKTGDATWNYSFFNTQSWTNTGGDYMITPSAIQTVEDTGNYTWSDVKLLEDIKIWRENPDSNFGWILIADDAINASKRFNSKDNPDRKPMLTLEIVSPANIRLKSNQTYKIFPNPSHGEFFISTDKELSLREITVTDIFGRTVMKEPDYFNLALNGSYQLFMKEKGIYFIRVNNSDFQKIVIL